MNEKTARAARARASERANAQKILAHVSSHSFSSLFTLLFPITFSNDLIVLIISPFPRAVPTGLTPRKLSIIPYSTAFPSRNG